MWQTSPPGFPDTATLHFGVPSQWTLLLCQCVLSPWKIHFWALDKSWLPRWLQQQRICLQMLAPWKESYDKPRQHTKKPKHHFAGKGPYQFSSVAQLYLTLCHPMDCSMPAFPIHHQLLEPAQTHVHWVGDGTQPSNPLSSSSPPALNLSQDQGLFQWVSSSHQMAKVLEFQYQHQSFQWIFRTDFL